MKTLINGDCLIEMNNIPEIDNVKVDYEKVKEAFTVFSLM